jgi:hypothetical protein
MRKKVATVLLALCKNDTCSRNKCSRRKIAAKCRETLTPTSILKQSVSKAVKSILPLLISSVYPQQLDIKRDLMRADGQKVTARSKVHIAANGFRIWSTNKLLVASSSYLRGSHLPPSPPVPGKTRASFEALASVIGDSDS